MRLGRRSRPPRRLAIAALALGLALTAAACGGGRDALTVYSGRSENLVGPLLERFSQETGIAIDVRYGDSTDLALLIAEEGERTPADVFLSQSPGTVEFLAGKGLLAPISEQTLAAVAGDGYRDPRGRWVGITARQRVLVYNRELVPEDALPQSVFDLTRPEYRGRVAVAPGNASFQDFVTAMRQAVGDDETRAWLRGMAANGSPAYANNNAIVEAVSRGEVPMGLVNHYYNMRFLAEDPSLPSRNYVFPNGDLGALVLVSTASILASTDRAADAERFIAFLLGSEAQTYFAEETFEYPLAVGAAPPAGLPPLSAVNAPAIDISTLGAGLEETARLIRESGLEGS